MEELYVKMKNGRYKKVGYIGIPDIQDGIWLVSSVPGVKTRSNLLARLDDIPDMVDVKKLAQCVMLENIIADVIVKFREKNITYAPADMAKEIAMEVYRRIINGS